MPIKPRTATLALAFALPLLCPLFSMAAAWDGPPAVTAAPAQPPRAVTTAPATATAPALQLVPLSGAPVSLSLDDFRQLPHETHGVSYPDGAEHQNLPAKLSGVSLRALLDRMGVPAGHNIHGDALQLYIVAEGADGYRAVLAVTEADPSFTDATLFVADQRGGQPLDAKEGPLRLIVPPDKRPARWVRQLVRLTVRRAS